MKHDKEGVTDSMEDHYVIRGQKKMRSGYTTGTCAAAAVKAALLSSLTDREQIQVSVALPKGGRAELPVHMISRNEYYVVKDAGDDPDVTNHCQVCGKAEWIDAKEIPAHAFSDEGNPRMYLTGGDGVGVVTKSGLSQEVGQAAINRVPREMIFSEACAVLEEVGEEEGIGKKEEVLLLTVSVPGGGEIAKRTFNPGLGIEGGISILGTSGIVDPMSEKALVDTIEVEIRQTIALGHKELLFVPGNYGERYVREDLGLKKASMIQCSN